MPSATTADVDAALHNVPLLRRTLGTNSTLLQYAATKHNLAQLLLQRGYLTAATRQPVAAVLDALAIVINLAAAAPEHTLCTAPSLLELLEGGYGAGVAADAAWALGNMAGAGASCRAQLRRVGCVGGLWAARRVPNALWALSVLLLDATCAGQLAHAVPPCAEELVGLLEDDEEDVVADDAAWVIVGLLAHGWLLQGLVEGLVRHRWGGAAVRGLGYAAAARDVGKRLRGMQHEVLRMLLSVGGDDGVPVGERLWAIGNWCGVAQQVGGAELPWERVEELCTRVADEELVTWVRGMVQWCR